MALQQGSLGVREAAQAVERIAAAEEERAEPGAVLAAPGAPGCGLGPFEQREGLGKADLVVELLTAYLEGCA